MEQTFGILHQFTQTSSNSFLYELFQSARLRSPGPLPTVTWGSVTDTAGLFAGQQHLFCTCPCAAHRNAAQKPRRLWIYGDIQNAKIQFKGTAFLKVHSCFEAAQPQYCKKQKCKVRQLLPLNKNFRQCELLTFNSLHCELSKSTG